MGVVFDVVETEGLRWKRCSASDLAKDAGHDGMLVIAVMSFPIAGSKIGDGSFVEPSRVIDLGSDPALHWPTAASCR